MSVRIYSSGSVTDSHRIPFSIRALLLIPTIRYSKLGAKILLFYELRKELRDYFILFAYIWLFQKKTVSLHSETKLSIDWPNYNSS